MTLIRIMAFVFIPLLSGCESMGYYFQAAKGQLSILTKKQPVDVLISDKNTDPALRRRLTLVKNAKRFAKENLGLEPDGNFSHYVDTGKDFVVWNVIAAEKFSLEPLEWCFPVAGCVAYRGYFNQADAIKKAKALKAAGYDVYIGGVRAYSTLGWFNDPLLNTFLFQSELDVVGLIFHELTHKKIYLPGDTGFNESFATAVQILGQNLWQTYQNKTSSRELLMLETRKSREINQFLLSYYSDIESLYNDDALTDKDKKLMKQSYLLGIYNDYLKLKGKRGWNDDYDVWIKTLNNAKLATVSGYNYYTEAFFQLREESVDFEAFYLAVNRLANLPKMQRMERLDQLRSTFRKLHTVH